MFVVLAFCDAELCGDKRTKHVLRYGQNVVCMHLRVKVKQGGPCWPVVYASLGVVPLMQIESWVLNIERFIPY